VTESLFLKLKKYINIDQEMKVRELNFYLKLKILKIKNFS